MGFVARRRTRDPSRSLHVEWSLCVKIGPIFEGMPRINGWRNALRGNISQMSVKGSLYRKTTMSRDQLPKLSDEARKRSVGVLFCWDKPYLERSIVFYVRASLLEIYLGISTLAVELRTWVTWLKNHVEEHESSGWKLVGVHKSGDWRASS